MVVASDCGHAKEFQCVYHGWTYHLDGRLKAVPLNHGYPSDFDTKNPKTSMTQVPRVESYRGFIFISQRPKKARASPIISATWRHRSTTWSTEHRTARSKWPAACSATPIIPTGSSISKTSATPRIRGSRTARRSTPRKQQSDDVYSDGTGEIAIRQMRQNGAPYSFWENQVGIWTYPNGHSYLGDYHDDKKLTASMEDPLFREYIGMLRSEEGQGRDRAHSRKCGAGIRISIRTCRS